MMLEDSHKAITTGGKIIFSGLRGDREIKYTPRKHVENVFQKT